jgi:phosphoribosylglycinamide formyltransferase 1
MAPLNIGVLLSGSGTNLQAIIDEIEAGRLNAKISLVVSSRPDAYGITRAQNSNIKTLVMDKTQYANPELADETIVEALKEAGAEYVVMAGYMRMVTPVMLNAYPNKVINLHPALLPSFKGAHGIKDAFDAGVKITGITVHFANAEYDKGPIIAQVAIPISEDDTLESLEEKIHTEEHKLYPKVLQLISEGKVNVLESGKVKIG